MVSTLQLQRRAVRGTRSGKWPRGERASRCGGVRPSFAVIEVRCVTEPSTLQWVVQPRVGGLRAALYGRWWWAAALSSPTPTPRQAARRPRPMAVRVPSSRTGRTVRAPGSFPARPAAARRGAAATPAPQMPAPGQAAHATRRIPARRASHASRARACPPSVATACPSRARHATTATRPTSTAATPTAPALRSPSTCRFKRPAR